MDLLHLRCSGFFQSSRVNKVNDRVGVPSSKHMAFAGEVIESQILETRIDEEFNRKLYFIMSYIELIKYSFTFGKPTRETRRTQALAKAHFQSQLTGEVGAVAREMLKAYHPPKPMPINLLNINEHHPMMPPGDHGISGSLKERLKEAVRQSLLNR